MAQTIESLERRFPWSFKVLRDKGIPMLLAHRADLTNLQIGDLALGDDGLVYEWDGGEWR